MAIKKHMLRYLHIGIMDNKVFYVCVNTITWVIACLFKRNIIHHFISHLSNIMHIYFHSDRADLLYSR